MSFGLVVEGAQSVVLACSLGLLIPAFGTVLGVRAGGRLRGIVVFGVAAGFGAWLTVAGWNGWATGRFMQIVIVGGGVAALWRGGHIVRLGGAGLIGVFAGLTWTPCVGEHFGTVLTGGVRDPWPALVPLIAYVLAVLLIALVGAAIVDYLPGLKKRTAGPRLRYMGIGFLVAVALLVGAGRYDALQSQLVRWSL